MRKELSERMGLRKMGFMEGRDCGDIEKHDTVCDGKAVESVCARQGKIINM